MRIEFKKSALAVMAAALAIGIMPAEPIAPSAWAERNLTVPDGPRAGQKFDLSLTPYVREILDFFADDCPDNKAVVRKCKQSGFTTAALVCAGYTIDVEPCDLFLIEPTDSNLSDFISLKLQTAIDGSERLAAKVAPQVTRSGKGSTTYLKRFPGGSLLLATANSSSELRGKTRKKVIRDEAAEYPKDLAGQGNPHDMIGGAYETFLTAGDWKDLWISTPTIKGDCAIDDEFEKGDKRFFFVKCPGCGCALSFDVDLRLFKFKKTFPHEAHYVAPCCGAVIEGYQRTPLIQSAEADGFGWIATAPGPGRFRSYHFDALSSPFVPWDVIAARIVAAGDDPEKQKTLDNLTFGQAYEQKGDAPDVTKLLERRDDYTPGIVPPAGLMFVCGADVQHNGIWYEAVAFAEDKQSWSIEHRFLEGDTTDPQKGAFLALAEVYDRPFPDSFGGQRLIEAFAVDAGDGGRANQVYAWCRARHRAFAVKGQPGWTTPAIGTPTRVSITLKGKKIKGGAMLWPVGTYSLKGTYYDNLRKDGARAGVEIDPPGYCHHHQHCDENYFRQQTAEYVKTVSFRGRSSRIWQETGPNHLLDCRVYAMAMADYLGMNRMTPDQWAMLRQKYAVPAPLKTPDLLSPESARTAQPHTPLLAQRRKRRTVSRGLS